FVFESVVGSAEWGEVVGGGGAAGGPGSGVVDVAVGGGAAAAGEDAGLVAGSQPSFQRGGDPVAGAVQVEDGAGDRVGEDPGERGRLPGQFLGGGCVDGSVSVEHRGLVTAAEEGEHRHGQSEADLDLDTHPAGVGGGA